MPLLCPVCGVSMLAADDTHVYLKYSCCSLCALRWVDVRRDEWCSGWRPSQEDVAQELARRRIRAKRINF